MTKDNSSKPRDYEEMSFDIERPSIPRPLAIISECRTDSDGLPIPPPPPPLAEPEPATPMTARSAFYDDTIGTNSIAKTPSPAKFPSFMTPRTPQTPDTVVSMQDHIIIFSPQHYKNDTDGSSKYSEEIVAENKPKKRWSLATKSAMVAIVFFVLAITMVIAAFVLMKEQKSDAAASSDLLTVRPTKLPTASPTPIPDLTLTPTTFGPTSFVWTSRPTQVPTLSPPEPTFKPTPGPTLPPTEFGATFSPTLTFGSVISFFLFPDGSTVDPTDPAVQKAVNWLSEEANAAQSIPFPLDQKYLQRFGILVLYFSIDPNGQSGLPNLDMRKKDECTWTGMRCNENGMVTKIKLPSRQFDGSLPDEWASFFPDLKSVDFSKNNLQGSIPEGLFKITQMEDFFLYKNQLTGTISSKIGNLWSIKKFHVSHNRLSGSIPPELASTPEGPGQKIRQISYFNVKNNQMTGTIPSNMRLRQLFLADLGNNRFSSTLPPDFGTESVRLRHLYLDKNNFSGTFPSEILNAGDGRLRTLVLNDNKFTGVFPGNHQYNNTMLELAIYNNNFASMQRSTCDIGVLSGNAGELVEFKADCLVCRCGVDMMCKNCVLK